MADDDRVSIDLDFGLSEIMERGLEPLQAEVRELLENKDDDFLIEIAREAYDDTEWTPDYDEFIIWATAKSILNDRGYRFASNGLNGYTIVGPDETLDSSRLDSNR